MKTYLLPRDGTFFKANLHCHTSMSDGTLSPEEMKAVYQKEGYSIVAFTDHDRLFPQNHLTDETFLALNGVELEAIEPNRYARGTGRCFHFCCIALEADNHYTPCFHSTMYNTNVNDAYKNDGLRIPGHEDKERIYSIDCFNWMSSEAKEAGFFITYNHPDYSLEDQSLWENYENINAIEIYNHASAVLGFLDYNPKVYDTLLRQGKKLYCLATDDNHNFGTPGTTSWDSFGGFVMIKAENLEYRTITKALEAGSFYASQGPMIHNLWIEDDKLHVDCTEAEKIILTTSRRRRGIVWANEGETVTSADFDIFPEDRYVRVTVQDHRGRFAETNAHFL